MVLPWLLEINLKLQKKIYIEKSKNGQEHCIELQHCTLYYSQEKEKSKHASSLRGDGTDSQVKAFSFTLHAVQPGNQTKDNIQPADPANVVISYKKNLRLVLRPTDTKKIIIKTDQAVSEEFCNKHYDRILYTRIRVTFKKITSTYVANVTNFSSTLSGWDTFLYGKGKMCKSQVKSDNNNCNFFSITLGREYPTTPRLGNCNEKSYSLLLI